MQAIGPKIELIPADCYTNYISIDVSNHVSVDIFIVGGRGGPLAKVITMLAAGTGRAGLNRQIEGGSGQSGPLKKGCFMLSGISVSVPRRRLYNHHRRRLQSGYVRLSYRGHNRTSPILC